jgi:AcrR family transcriptional regulator
MPPPDTATKILDAARACLLADGYAAMSTRRVADEAGVPLSQIHYHFGSKDDLILSLLRAEDEGLQARQSEAFASDLPVWKKWELACDYFDQDLASGYVRVLNEMMAAGWSSDALGKEMREIFGSWIELLTGLAREAEAKGMRLTGLSAEELAALVAVAFVGAESFILIGMEEQVPLRATLRKIGDLIRIAEEGIG